MGKIIIKLHHRAPKKKKKLHRKKNNTTAKKKQYTPQGSKFQKVRKLGTCLVVTKGVQLGKTVPKMVWDHTSPLIFRLRKSQGVISMELDESKAVKIRHMAEKSGKWAPN